jgi:hypothetical protein
MSEVNTSFSVIPLLAKKAPSNDDFLLFKEENPLDTINYQNTCAHTNPILSQN